MIKTKTNRAQWLILLICLITLNMAPTSFGQEHPLYISICQIDYNSDTNALEVTFKIFTEDLELAMEEQGVEPLRLGTDREAEDADTYIGRYLEKNVQIEVNERPVSFQYLGKEVEMDVTWCYAEIPEVPNLKKITVSNTLLLELFDEQTNIVHIKANDKKKSMMLNIAKSADTVEF